METTYKAWGHPEYDVFLRNCKSMEGYEKWNVRGFDVDLLGSIIYYE